PNTGGRVTFQSENGNAAGVNITYSSNVSSIDPTINFNGASGFTFRKVTVTAGPTYGQAFVFGGASNDDSLLGCIMKAPANTSSSYNSCIWANGTGMTGKGLVIKGNT